VTIALGFQAGRLASSDYRVVGEKQPAAGIELKIAKERLRAKTVEEKVAERLGRVPRDENDLWAPAL
jgi:hypothetical protein